VLNCVDKMELLLCLTLSVLLDLKLKLCQIGHDKDKIGHSFAGSRIATTFQLVYCLLMLSNFWCTGRQPDELASAKLLREHPSTTRNQQLAGKLHYIYYTLIN
jgi:hypothetical protein